MHDTPFFTIEDETTIAHSIFGARASLTKLGVHLDTEELFFKVLPLLASPCSMTSAGTIITPRPSSTRLLRGGKRRLAPLTLSLDSYDVEADTDLVAVRCLELVEKGMKVHVGPPEASWI
jgi:hypothetical protein